MAARSDLLMRYRQKRDFTQTAEPEGKSPVKAGFHYLIQKHAATRLHYDFRLELDGVLKSWAVTRGPSLDPADKRLAVEVEDHPVEYGSFEGTIPKGQYGGGTVMLWDEGYWEPIGDPKKGLAAGKLEFRLHGKRLRGEWTLVRMRGRETDRGRNNWLLIKHRDGLEKVGDADSLLLKNATSVASGRSMEKIAAAGDRVWKSKPKSPVKPVRTNNAKKKSGKKLKMPAFIAPELATLTDSMPQGENWVHEIKFDGYRALAYLNNGNATIHTRTGLDWTPKFIAIAELLAQLPIKTAIFDGEITAVNNEGISSFKELQKALTEGNSSTLQYYVFDLLFLNGKDIRKLSLQERKKLLAPLLKNKKLTGKVLYSEHVAGQDETFLQQLCSHGMEGVISKRADAPYTSGRGRNWLKTKCHKRQEFVIGGFTNPTHAERGVGALLIGYYEAGEFIYAGKVGTGFDHATSLALRKKLNALALKTSAFESVPAEGKRGAHWVNPQLVCEVEFTEWTADGRLRHPSFQGLREDKPAKYIHRDITSAPLKALVRAKRTAKVTIKKDAEVSSITITHPERIIYPGTKLTKLDLAEYYEAVAGHILPHVKNRPLSMLRCPEGIGAQCFFQRHIAQGQSPYLHDTGVKVKDRGESYLMIKDIKGLITLTQWGVIELHPWGCLADKPELPDRIIFDLDPDPSVPWKYVIEGAKEVRERMQELGLESFVKTTGGKGLHVVVPLVRQQEWKPVKAFARAIAESMERDNPKRYIAKANKAARKGKIFVDYLRNDLTATAIAPFSVRAREHAPAAMTLAWEDLKPTLRAIAFTLQSVPNFLNKRKDDPWEEFFTLKQKINAKHLRALRIIP